MRVLLAILFPPGYFFVAGRPIAGLIHLIIWAISIPLFFVGIGIFIYFAQVLFAVWDLRRHLMIEQATIMAEKMAEKLKPSEPQL